MGTNSILKELPGGQMADQLTGFDKLATAQRDELLRKLQQQVEENDDVSEEYSSWVRGEISSSAAANEMSSSAVRRVCLRDATKTRAGLVSEC